MGRERYRCCPEGQGCLETRHGGWLSCGVSRSDRYRHSKTIGPLLNKAEACSAALEPTDKVQFDQESGLRREACRILLSIKNEVYSQKTDSHPLGQCNKRNQQAFRCLVIISINLRARKTMDCLGCITQLRIYSKGERNKVYISYYT